MRRPDRPETKPAPLQPYSLGLDCMFKVLRTCTATVDGPPCPHPSFPPARYRVRRASRRDFVSDLTEHPNRAIQSPTLPGSSDTRRSNSDFALFNLTSSLLRSHHHNLDLTSSHHHHLRRTTTTFTTTTRDNRELITIRAFVPPRFDHCTTRPVSTATSFDLPHISCHRRFKYSSKQQPASQSTASRHPIIHPSVSRLRSLAHSHSLYFSSPVRRQHLFVHPCAQYHQVTSPVSLALLAAATHLIVLSHPSSPS